MADEIRVNYEELAQVASRFTNQAQVVEQMLRKVRGCVEKLEDDGWIGMGADSFFAEMDGEVLPAVGRMIAALREGATQANAIAQTMQQAEEETRALFAA